MELDLSGGCLCRAEHDGRRNAELAADAVRGTQNGGVRMMSYSLSAACCWIILAAILAAIPSQDNHWRRAYFLMALCAPILVWVYMSDGIYWGLAFTLAVLSVFRWPLRYLGAWIIRQVMRPTE